jgi:hypothetical protein
MEHLSLTEEAIIKILAYYAIFRHPLLSEEITKRIGIKLSDDEQVATALVRLTRASYIDECDGYYMLKGSKDWVDRRHLGESRAVNLMKAARRMSKVIYWFPFVRAVFISGSLSKGSVPEDADVDYFIVTKKNRLWIARTLLVMFKRAFLLGSKKYFCVNYFVDENHLEIPDKNIFTATEVSTVIPMRGSQYCKAFIAQNGWYRDFYPNINLTALEDSGPGFLKRFSKAILEPLFFHALAEKLDKYFMKKTYRRWTNMYGEGYSDQEFELAFRSHRGTSKNHDKNFQKRVLNKVQENINNAIGSINTDPIHG